MKVLVCLAVLIAAAAASGVASYGGKGNRGGYAYHGKYSGQCLTPRLLCLQPRQTKFCATKFCDGNRHKIFASPRRFVSCVIYDSGEKLKSASQFTAVFVRTKLRTATVLIEQESAVATGSTIRTITGSFLALTNA